MTSHVISQHSESLSSFLVKIQFVKAGKCGWENDSIFSNFLKDSIIFGIINLDANGEDNKVQDAIL